MGTSDFRTQVTDRMLAEALMALLSSKPLGDITVKELCEEAGVTRGTFYRHYENIMEVYEAVEDQLLYRLEDTISSFDLSELDADFFKGVLGVLSDGKEISDLIRNGEDKGRFIAKVMTFLRPRFLQALRKRKPEVGEAEAELAFTYLVGGVKEVIEKWAEGEIRLSTEELASSLSALSSSLFHFAL